jgi:hypothetical protein
MTGCLLAYDAAGNVIATLDWVVQRDANGTPIGVVDFAAHESADGEHTDIWTVQGAVGSKHWPEWLGIGATRFRVELDGPSGHKRLAALVERNTGHRRERGAIEQAIANAPLTATGERDLRAIVGGPWRALLLDEEGRTRERPQHPDPVLPMLARR